MNRERKPFETVIRDLVADQHRRQNQIFTPSESAIWRADVLFSEFDQSATAADFRRQLYGGKFLASLERNPKVATEEARGMLNERIALGWFRRKVGMSIDTVLDGQAVFNLIQSQLDHPKPIRYSFDEGYFEECHESDGMVVQDDQVSSLIEVSLVSAGSNWRAKYEKFLLVKYHPAFKDRLHQTTVTFIMPRVKGRPAQRAHNLALREIGQPHEIQIERLPFDAIQYNEYFEDFKRTSAPHLL